MSSPGRYLVIIIGPTGIGKTDLSINIASDWNTEIISCDSRQMYREIKIGTAAPSQQQLAAVPHHFIGNLSIHEYYNVFHYETDVLNLLGEMYKKYKLVILTGGSGLYLDAVLYGMDDIPDPDPELRLRLTKRIQEQGVNVLAEELKSIDPEYYSEVDINNPNRVLRGLEVWYTTGNKFSSYRIKKNVKRPFIPLFVNLEMPREELYERINLRVDLMMKEGLKDEALRLYPHKGLNALNTVGYKEWFGHFDGDYPEEEAIRLIKRNSRHYAKRQITWNKKYPDMLQAHPESVEKINEWIKSQTGSSG